MEEQINILAIIGKQQVEIEVLRGKLQKALDQLKNITIQEQHDAPISD